jgi:hypothetical protein
MNVNDNPSRYFSGTDFFWNTDNADNADQDRSFATPAGMHRWAQMNPRNPFKSN